MYGLESFTRRRTDGRASEAQPAGYGTGGVLGSRQRSGLAYLGVLEGAVPLACWRQSRGGAPKGWARVDLRCCASLVRILAGQGQERPVSHLD